METFIPLVLFVILHKPFHDLILGYSTQQLELLHDEEDLLGIKLNTKLRSNDKKFGSRWNIPIALTICLSLLHSHIHWGLFYELFKIRLLILLILSILFWKYIFVDIDLASQKTLYKERILLLICFAGCFFTPKE